MASLHDSRRFPVSFAPFVGSVRRGTLSAMLRESYAPLLDTLPAGIATDLCSQWDEYDESVVSEPDTVGASGFLTSLHGEPIGFGSWDPRGWPAIGRVGHNCIVPTHQRKGYGQLQLREIMRRLRAMGFGGIEVRTDEHPFFEPARRMYMRYGFKLMAYEPGVLSARHRMLVYGLRCSDAA